MLPKAHIILGIIISAILFYFFKVSLTDSILFFLASVFIDFDHYMDYFFRHRDLNLKKAYYWHRSLGKNHKPIPHIFHSFEFLLIFFIFTLFYPIISFIFLGFVFHSLCDILEMAYNHKFDCREYLLIRYLLSDKSRYL